MTCPTCHKKLDDTAATSCPSCGARIPGPEERFTAPVGVLKSITHRILRREIPLTPDRISDLFAHVTGAVQQLLDSVREELDESFRTLSQRAAEGMEDLPESERPDVVRTVQMFGDLQRQINEALVGYGEVLMSSRDPRDLEMQQPVLDQLTARLQDGVSRLAVLEAETRYPILAEPAAEPLPPEVVHCLECVEQAMRSVTRFMDERNRDDLSECLRQLDAAREPLSRLLADLEDAEPAPETESVVE